MEKFTCEAVYWLTRPSSVHRSSKFGYVVPVVSGSVDALHHVPARQAVSDNAMNEIF